MALNAKLGALMPFRAAADVLAEFPRGQSPKRFTTLRHRALSLGKRLEEKLYMFRETLDARERRQGALPLSDDLEREFVLGIDTAHIPKVRGRDTRRFEAVICHASRGGAGSGGGTLFAFAGTSRPRMRVEAHQAPFRLGYEGKGEITVISDGAEYLKRLRKALPQPATHILDWFHIAMKLRLIEHRAASLSRRPLSEALSDLAEKIACLRWRIRNGQAERALARVSHLLRLSKGDELGSTTSHLLQQGLMTLRTYIEQNLDV